MRIKLEYADLISKADQLRNQEETFGDCINQMQRIIGELQAGWEGRSADAYAEQFSDLLPAFEQTKNLINMIQNERRQTVQDMQTADEKIASRLVP